MSNESTVKVEHDALVLGPLRVTFQRTLRIPVSGLHDLPPGLGAFPIRRVEDYPDTVPTEWLARGGVMLPIYQREAMWMSFDSDEPAALQVAAGKVCAISGEAWSEQLKQEPQNYAALPDQPWLDGINAGDGFIRQFVAVPLGLGATVEAQVTGEEVHGGVQLRAVGVTPKVLGGMAAASADRLSALCRHGRRVDRRCLDGARRRRSHASGDLRRRAFADGLRRGPLLASFRPPLLGIPVGCDHR